MGKREQEGTEIYKSVILLLVLSSALGAADAPRWNFEKLVFVKRHTYTANHYYTEHINSAWLPGGNLCVLDVTSGEEQVLVPELQHGVFGRFDLDFDSRHIVFAWKASNDVGYRIYEIEVNPETGERTGALRQLTTPPEEEAELTKRYRNGYHHGTDDMDPCYLPDGGIVFISTRVQYGTLCDGPDIFTTTVLYRMERDGSKMKRLSNNSVSEHAPSILPDGRILYTRWEYVDKGAVSVKCLWAMNVDGSSSVEIYGADIALPPTMIYGRSIPGSRNQYVMLGAPHCPQNGVGTVIRLDMDKAIRTREPMTYLTPDIDIRSEGGFHFRNDGEWVKDPSGKMGPLYREPFPLSRNSFLVSRKAPGRMWKDASAYDLVLLHEDGSHELIYDDPEISCFCVMPFRSRTRPPIVRANLNPELAKQNLATCVVTDVYHGMEEVERGSVKYIRILEHQPRPWAARRNWGGDCVAQQHATVSKGTHHAVKLQHGVVPVEEDGSAHFLVPADKNIFFHALDEHYMALQKERTFINYIAGETRSCIGCHETPNDVATAMSSRVLKALQRPPSVPQPQPGDDSAQRVLDYVQDVQPVLDRHCIDCHSDKNPEGGLNLTGRMTAMFTVSYEALLNKKYMPFVGENFPKTGHVDYVPARSYGAQNSVLAAMLAPDKITLKDPGQAKWADELAKAHEDVSLSPDEFLKITNWIDTNGQFYGMYWGRKNLQYKEHPNFRPVPTFARAASLVSQLPEEER